MTAQTPVLAAASAPAAAAAAAAGEAPLSPPAPADGPLRQGMHLVSERSPALLKSGALYARNMAVPVLDYLHLLPTAGRLAKGGDALVGAVDGKLNAAEKKVHSVSTWTKGKVSEVSRQLTDKVSSVSSSLLAPVGAGTDAKEPALAAFAGDAASPSASDATSVTSAASSTDSNASLMYRGKAVAMGALSAGARRVVAVVPPARLEAAKAAVMTHGGQQIFNYAHEVLAFAQARVASASESSASTHLAQATQRLKAALSAVHQSLNSVGQQGKARVGYYAQPISANTTAAFAMLHKVFDSRSSLFQVPSDLVKLTVQTMGLKAVDEQYAQLVPQVRSVFVSLADVSRLLHAPPAAKDEIELAPLAADPVAMAPPSAHLADDEEDSVPSDDDEMTEPSDSDAAAGAWR